MYRGSYIFPVTDDKHSLTNEKGSHCIVVFSMSSFVAVSRLVHNGGYIQKLSQLFNSPKILLFGRLYLVTKASLNLDTFCSVFGYNTVLQTCEICHHGPVWNVS